MGSGNLSSPLFLFVKVFVAAIEMKQGQLCPLRFILCSVHSMGFFFIIYTICGHYYSTTEDSFTALKILSASLSPPNTLILKSTNHWRF